MTELANQKQVRILLQICHRLTVVHVLFCNLKMVITTNVHTFCFVIINSVPFNPVCVWTKTVVFFNPFSTSTVWPRQLVYVLLRKI